MIIASTPNKEILTISKEMQNCSISKQAVRKKFNIELSNEMVPPEINTNRLPVSSNLSRKRYSSNLVRAGTTDVDQIMINGVMTDQLIETAKRESQSQLITFDEQSRNGPIGVETQIKKRNTVNSSRIKQMKISQHKQLKNKLKQIANDKKQVQNKQIIIPTGDLINQFVDKNFKGSQNVKNHRYQQISCFKKKELKQPQDDFEIFKQQFNEPHLVGQKFFKKRVSHCPKRRISPFLKDVPITVPEHYETNLKVQTINLEDKYQQLYKKLNMDNMCNTETQMEIPFDQMIFDQTLDKMEMIFSNPPVTFRKKTTDTISDMESCYMQSKLNSHRSHINDKNFNNYLKLSAFERDELIKRFKNVQSLQLEQFAKNNQKAKTTKTTKPVSIDSPQSKSNMQTLENNFSGEQTTFINRKDTVTDMQNYPSLNINLASQMSLLSKSPKGIQRLEINQESMFGRQTPTIFEYNKPSPGKFKKRDINVFENLNDEEIQYLMYMQSRGLDAQGKPLTKNDSQLDKLINMYLNRQLLAPSHYKLRENQKDKSVILKMFSNNNIKKQFNKTTLGSFTFNEYQNIKQAQFLQLEFQKFMNENQESTDLPTPPEYPMMQSRGFEESSVQVAEESQDLPLSPNRPEMPMLMIGQKHIYPSRFHEIKNDSIKITVQNDDTISNSKVQTALLETVSPKMALLPPFKTPTSTRQRVVSISKIGSSPNRSVVFGRVSAQKNESVTHQQNISVSNLQCSAIEELIDLSNMSPYPYERPDEKHLKIEKLDYSEDRELELFMPKQKYGQEDKQKRLLQELAINQERINALESNIKDQFGSKRYLGGNRPKIQGFEPLVNMDLHQYFKTMEKPFEKPIEKPKSRVESKIQAPPPERVLTPPQKNVIYLNDTFNKVTPRLKTSDQAFRGPKVIRSNTKPQTAEKVEKFEKKTPNLTSNFDFKKRDLVVKKQKQQSLKSRNQTRFTFFKQDRKSFLENDVFVPNMAIHDQLQKYIFK